MRGMWKSWESSRVEGGHEENPPRIWVVPQGGCDLMAISEFNNKKVGGSDGKWVGQYIQNLEIKATKGENAHCMRYGLRTSGPRFGWNLRPMSNYGGRFSLQIPMENYMFVGVSILILEERSGSGWLKFAETLLNSIAEGHALQGWLWRCWSCRSPDTRILGLAAATMEQFVGKEKKEAEAPHH